MVDEFTQKRINRLAKGFVDVYVSDGEGRPAEAGAWANHHVPEEFRDPETEETEALQAAIAKEFAERGWEIEEAV